MNDHIHCVRLGPEHNPRSSYVLPPAPPSASASASASTSAGAQAGSASAGTITSAHVRLIACASAYRRVHVYDYVNDIALRTLLLPQVGQSATEAYSHAVADF